MRTYAADCRAATIENLLDRRYCLQRTAVRSDVNTSIVKCQLRIVDQEIARRKENAMSGEAETCRVPECGLKAQNRGLCYKHQADPEAKAQYALPSRQGSPRPRKPKPPTGGSAVRPPSRTPSATHDDLVVAIPRAEVTDDLAALLFRRGARVV